MRRRVRCLHRARRNILSNNDFSILFTGMCLSEIISIAENPISNDNLNVKLVNGSHYSFLHGVYELLLLLIIGVIVQACFTENYIQVPLTDAVSLNYMTLKLNN